MTLYERLGGAPAVNAAAELFYQKVLADQSLAPFFADIDMNALKAKQVAFLSLAFGGPNEYTGMDLRSAHAGLGGLDDEHFDRVVTLLAQTLSELGVPEQEIAEAGKIASSVRNDVLNR